MIEKEGPAVASLERLHAQSWLQAWDRQKSGSPPMETPCATLTAPDSPREHPMTDMPIAGSRRGCTSTCTVSQVEAHPEDIP